jgi:hypothetical protein
MKRILLATIVATCAVAAGAITSTASAAPSLEQQIAAMIKPGMIHGPIKCTTTRTFGAACTVNIVGPDFAHHEVRNITLFQRTFGARIRVAIAELAQLQTQNTFGGNVSSITTRWASDRVLVADVMGIR